MTHIFDFKKLFVHTNLPIFKKDTTIKPVYNNLLGDELSVVVIDGWSL